MVIKLIMLLKSGGALVEDIPTSDKTVEDDVDFVDGLLDDIFDAMNTGALIRFEDKRVRNFVVNGKALIGVQYVITEEEGLKEVKKK